MISAPLAQIEQRVEDWMGDDTESGNARRAAKLVRIQIMANWHDGLDDVKDDAERRWCIDRIQRLATEAFGENDNTVLRLTPAVPIVVRIEELPEMHDDSESEAQAVQSPDDDE